MKKRSTCNSQNNKSTKQIKSILKDFEKVDLFKYLGVLQHNKSGASKQNIASR